MATYILLSTLTDHGAQKLHSDPDRMLAVNAEMEAFGCKVKDQYAVLGSYDFVTVIEAADNETVAHLSADLASRGTIKVTTLPAISVTDLIAKMKEPHELGRS